MNRGIAMTMHLAQGLSTTRTTKPKHKRRTKAQQEKLIEEHRAFNKRMKQAGRHSERMTFDEYVDYVYGTAPKKPRPERQVAPEVKTYQWSKPAHMRETPEYRSVDTGAGVAAKPERKEYTGTLIKGIATMHKSNAVPVLGEEDAKEISRMRRG